MITNFELENFKSFAGKQALPFAPITLIFGPNSSGKSSVIQSLMMLKQTALSEDRTGNLVTSGEAIDLGTFESLVHGQKTEKQMKFSIEYSANHDAEEFQHEHSYPLLFSNKLNRKISLSYKCLKNRPTLDYFKFSCGGLTNEKVNYELLQNPIKLSKGITYKTVSNESLRGVLSSRLNLNSNDSIGWRNLDDDLAKSFGISDKLNFPESLSQKESPVNEYTRKVLDDVKYVFNNLKYLGPLRSSPKRYYSNEISNYQKGQGKSNLGFMLYNSDKNTTGKINKFLNKFDIPYEINAMDLGNLNTGPLISIQLKDLRNGAIVTPKDVGFGIGQVLPIILEATVSHNKLICVEQPEIHLHPRLQAHLADLFIDSVHSSDNQWVIETHSEALMLRVQRRIREKTLDKKMVSVLYVDVGESGAQVTPISLDDEGDFTTAWPEGFFEERLNEIFGE